MTDLAGRIAELSPEKLRLLTQRLGKKPSDGGRLSQVVPAPGDRHLPFPLTDIQQAYWIGRQSGIELGHVSAHSYMEFESGELDIARFEQAWRRLIDRHDMLRAVFLADGSQQILPEVPPFTVSATDLRGRDPREAAAHLAAMREELSHQVLPADRWPLFEIRASLLDGGKVRLHFSFDIMIADLWSFRLLLRDLAVFYQDPAADMAPLELSFRDYVLAERALRNSEPHRRSLEYWRARLAELPPSPQLPLERSGGAALAAPRFARRRATLDAGRWSRLKTRATHLGLTPSGLLLGIYATVLATWSRSPRFTLNLTLFNRLPLHPEVNQVVGDFTSLNLLAVDVDLAAPLRQTVREIQEQLWRDLEHSYMSGVQLLRELARVRGDGAGARMPVVFTSTLGQEGQGAAGDVDALAVESVYSISQTPQVWLDHQVAEEGGALGFNWDAVEDLFPAGLLDEMFGAYRGLLERLAQDEGAWEEPPLALAPSRHRELIESVNATSAPLPEGLLHSGFLARAASAPGRPAVIAGSRTLSYGELAARSRSLALRLRDLAVRPDELVAVVMEKGWEQAVGVLGVLESGGAYLPIEAGVPGERLRQLLSLGGVRVAVTQPSLAAVLDWPSGIERVLVEDGPELEGAPLAAAQSPSDLAYVIFTSGSTGEPKGVMIEHRAALNTVADVNRRFGLGAEDRVLALSSLSFDLSVYDVFGVLSSGGAVVMPEPWAAREPGRWHELMSEHGVTVWDSVPALFEVLVDWAESRNSALAPSLRLALLSGDWLPLSLPDRARRLGAVEVVSLGGATEGSIWSILYPIGTVLPEWRSIPYGRAMANQRMYVLNEALSLCPAWVPGDLYIGGAGVARGYWGAEERTAASFLVHPRTGERLYRTGDLGRFLPDGTIEFLGREDFQVKVQGYRIELGEIESVLSRHAAVRSCVVAALGEAQGSKRLVAYVVGEPGGEESEESLRAYLAGKLPAYMVPSSYVFLESLPLSATGKVDRRALPPPLTQRHEAVPGAQPGGSNLAERVYAVIGSVLKTELLDPDVLLFDLGATSIEMVRVANLLEIEFGSRPTIDELFRLSTPRSVVGYYEARLAAPPPTPAPPVSTPVDPVDSAWTRFGLLLDPAERAAFKERDLGLRADAAGTRSLDLAVPGDGQGALAALLATRRSYRRFSPEPIPRQDLASLLGVLRRIAEPDGERRLYPSAGGLYPVQTYLYAKAGRVEGLEGGVYYHHPAAHRLVALAPGAEIDPGIYVEFINRPVYDEAAFALFLIAEAQAVAPMYGRAGRDFSLLEAGYMGQLLMLAAPACEIGLCPIGAVDFARVRRHFALADTHVLLHSLLGGRIGASAAWEPFQEEPAGSAGEGPREDIEL